MMPITTPAHTTEPGDNVYAKAWQKGPPEPTWEAALVSFTVRPTAVEIAEIRLRIHPRSIKKSHQENGGHRARPVRDGSLKALLSPRRELASQCTAED